MVSGKPSRGSRREFDADGVSFVELESYEVGHRSHLPRKIYGDGVVSIPQIQSVLKQGYDAVNTKFMGQELWQARFQLRHLLKYMACS